MYFDPRYPLFSDMPGVVDETNGVRIADLERSKDKYINLDILKLMPSPSAFTEDPDSYKQKIFNLTGMMQTDMKQGVDLNSLSMKTYYGLYTITDAE